MLGQGEAIKEFQPRFPILMIVITVIFCLLGLRMFFLQIIRGEFYRTFSEQQSLRKEKIPGPRGQIFDRNNHLLVDNRLQLDIAITPQFVKSPAEVIGALAAIIKEDPKKLLEKYKARVAGAFKFQPVVLVENASWEAVVKIESNRSHLSGVEIEQRIRRTYLNEKVGSHVFGYLSEVTKKEIASQRAKGVLQNYEQGDWIGRSGLEKSWENYLRGNDGARFVEVDAHGHRITDSRQRALLRELPGNIDPVPGKTLYLTLDEELQMTAAEAMLGKMGAAVALDPRTGEVLAMLSNPGFDPTELVTRGPELWTSIINNPYEPLRNKAIQDHYPSGSTFKIFTALAALESNVVSESSTVNCSGSFRFGSRVFNCHKKEGHGPVNLHSAIAGSCDVYFYQIAAKLGIDSISNMAKRFGFGQKTGIELGNELTGLMPTEEWKKKRYNQPWSPGETLSAAIGQGANLVTPLQLAVAYATLINGGNLYRPYIVSRVEDLNGEIVESFGPKLQGTVKINQKDLAVIKAAMNDVANAPGGTAQAILKTPEKLISGKSGTAQVMSFTKEELFKPCINLPFEKRHHAWFVGYAPQENPEIVVAVLGLHECGGSRNAAPVVKAVIEKYFQRKKDRQLQIAGPSLIPQAELEKAIQAKRKTAINAVPKQQVVSPQNEDMDLDEDALLKAKAEKESQQSESAAPVPLPQDPIPLDD